MKDAIAKQATNHNVEKSFLVEQLKLIDAELQPIQSEIETARILANASASRYGLAFFWTLALQFAFSQYGTYIAFSWDIIEPITACMTLSDAIAAYLFWLWAGKPWDIDGLKSHFFERRQRKLFKKLNVSYEKYRLLEQTKAELMKKLAEH